MIEVKLAKETQQLTVQCSFYLRPKNSKRLLNTDQLGELVYRTRTEWSKLESSNLRGSTQCRSGFQADRDGAFPNKLQANVGYSNIEILAVWQHVPGDILSDVETSKEFVIGQEFIPPSNLIERVYCELESKLETCRCRSGTEEAKASLTLIGPD